MSALKNLHDRLRQVECEKQEAEQNLNKLAASGSSTQSTGKSLFWDQHILVLKVYSELNPILYWIQLWNRCFLTFCVWTLNLGIEEICTNRSQDFTYLTTTYGGILNMQYALREM